MKMKVEYGIEHLMECKEAIFDVADCETLEPLAPLKQVSDEAFFAKTEKAKSDVKAEWIKELYLTREEFENIAGTVVRAKNGRKWKVVVMIAVGNVGWFIFRANTDSNLVANNIDMMRDFVFKANAENKDVDGVSDEWITVDTVSDRFKGNAYIFTK